jgi:lysozyme family protein
MADFEIAYNQFTPTNDGYHNASFEPAHKMVAKSEGGYSTLEWDRGNYICDVGGKGYSASGKSQSGKTAKDFTCSSGTLKFVGTNWGISAPVLAEYFGRTPTANDMKNLSFSTAKSIFKKNYWDKMNGDNIKDQSVANMMYDSIVQSGEGGAKSILNKSFNELNLGGVSSLSSPDTLVKINKANPEKLFESFKKHRIEAYKSSGQTWGVKRTSDIIFEFVKRNKTTIVLGFLTTALLVGTAIYYWKNRKAIEAPLP